MSGEAQDGLRTDYGGFNPRFVGLTFLFDSPDDYNFVYCYLTDTPVPEGCGETMSDLHRISLLSVVDHETRHYIDFLLSPYSMTIYSMRIQALINGIQAATAARAMGGDVVPVPLTKWATLDRRLRAAQEAEWSGLFGRQMLPVDLPEWTPESLLSNIPPTIARLDGEDEAADAVRYVEAAIRAYARIEQLTRGLDAALPENFLRTPYVHEASALTAQLGAIWRGQGLAEFAQFTRFLLDSQSPQARMWQLCYQLATLIDRAGHTPMAKDDNPLIPIRRIPTITMWSLFGNYQLDGAHASAAQRLHELLALVVADPSNTRWSCDMDDADSIREMWDYWDACTGFSPWKSSLTAGVSMTRRRAETYRALRADWTGATEVLDSMIAVAEELIAHQDLATATFRGDLTTVVDPFKYVIAEAEAFPHPDIRLEFTRFGIDPARAALGRPILRRSAAGETYASGVAFNASGGTNLDAKLQLESLAEWCDVLFSDLPVPEHVATSARKALTQLTGKRLLQVL